MTSWREWKGAIVTLLSNTSSPQISLVRYLDVQKLKCASTCFLSGRNKSIRDLLHNSNTEHLQFLRKGKKHPSYTAAKEIHHLQLQRGRCG